MPTVLDSDALFALAEQPDIGPFMDAAARVVAEDGADDRLLLLLIRHLAQDGLLGRARAYAEHCSPGLRSDEQFRLMLRNLHDAGNRPDWSLCEERFAQNLAALRKRTAPGERSTAERIEATWRKLRDRLELHRNRAGHWLVFDRAAQHWRPGFGAHIPVPPAAKLAEQFHNQIIAPILLVGVGLGHHLPWLHEATRDTFIGAAPVLYQVETSWEAIAVALHLADWRTALADPRVRLCLGEDALEQLGRQVRADSANYPPAVIVRARAWQREHPPVDTVLSHSVAAFESRRLALFEQVSATYGGRDRAWWHRRFREALAGDGPPLRVLGLTCRFSTVLRYSMRDWLRAFEENGCQTRLLIEPTNYARITPPVMLEAIAAFEPDLFVIIDHTRQGQKAGLPDGLPVLTWIQDRMPHLFSRDAGNALGPLDFCMGFCHRELIERWGYPAERFLACGMATNAAALMPPGVDPADVYAGRACEDPGPYACDVAFATTHSRTPAELHAELRQRYDPRLRRLVDAAYEELAARCERNDLNGGLLLDPFVRSLESATGVELSPELRGTIAEEHVRIVADQMLRHQTIAWAVSWAQRTGRRLHLYGRNWERHPRFARYARGFVPHGPELGRAFRAAKVNLHAGCNNALHQRVLDGLAAGGFFLIRRHADDLSYPLWEARYAAAQRLGLAIGDLLRREDLPAKYRELWNTITRMRGLAPEAPFEITADFHKRFVEARDAETPPSPKQIWPSLDEVTFGSADELAQQLDTYLADEKRRKRVAASMRERMLDKYGYRGLVRRLLGWLPEALAPQQATRASRHSQQRVERACETSSEAGRRI